MDLPEILRACSEYAPRVGELLLLNQLVYPLCGILQSTLPESRIRIGSEEVDGLDSVVSELDVRDFVNIANSSVYQHAEKHHVCRHYAEATMEVYHRLIDTWKRADLSGTVRLVATDDHPEAGHMWLEILEEGEWVPYESFNGTSKLSGATVKEYSRRTKERKGIINGVENPRDAAFFRSLPGKRCLLPTKRAFLYPGGMIRILVNFIQDKLKERCAP